MTACPSFAQQALEKLSEQLTCPICLEQYTDPKLLHCFHVFCEKCLKPVARQTPQGQVVECPNCRHPTSLTQEGVPGLQGAFLIHHLFDIQDILKQVNAPATMCVKCKKREPNCYCRSCGFLCDKCKYSHLEWVEYSSHKIVSLDQLTEDVAKLVPPDQKTLKCSRHPSRELDLYCETCKEVICRDCIVKAHHGHQYDLVTEAFPQQKDVLLASIKPAEQQLTSVNKALEDLDTLRGEITSQRHTLETRIRVRVGLIHEALKAREEELVSQLDQMTEQKLENVAAQQGQLELVSTRLKSYCGFLQESLRTGSQVEILAMAESFLQVHNVMSSFEPEPLVPKEENDLDFFINDTEVIQKCWELGNISSVCYDKCSVKGTGLHVALVGEEATATLHVAGQKGREYQHPVEVGCELVSSDGSSRVRGEARRVRDGKHEISYCARKRGRHYLHIRLENQHIPGSPYPLSVITAAPTSIISGLSGPWGLAVNKDGEVLVVEHSRHCVSIFSVSGGSRKSFGSRGLGPDRLNCPYGVAISATGDILVTESWNHRVHVFSPDGKSVKCVGTRGSRSLQFNYPVGIAVHPQSSKIYVTEHKNHRVQILSEDLTFYKVFGSRGSDEGHFKDPSDIGFDSSGNVYVADAGNHRIQVFTADGEYIQQFGNKGSGEGELNGPKGIAVDSNDMVYITESVNHRISIFTREGKFLRSFGSQGKRPGQFKYPSGITVSNYGVLYVSDYYCGCVQVF